MQNQSTEQEHLKTAQELVTKAYHEENIQSELSRIPANERKDVIDKMRTIDKEAHKIATGGTKFPELDIVDQDGKIFVGVKGEKIHEPSFGERIMSVIRAINDTKIMKDEVLDADGKVGTKWLGSVRT